MHAIKTHGENSMMGDILGSCGGNSMMGDLFYGGNSMKCGIL